MNRPRAIGTAAETAVMRAAQRSGFPFADRRALRGRKDVGDITLCPGVIVEVKGGDAARNASDLGIGLWLAETERERQHAKADVGLLVVQRARVGYPNAHRWWAWWALDDLARMRGPLWENPLDTVGTHPVRTTLETAFLVLRAFGYGDPLPSPHDGRPADDR